MAAERPGEASSPRTTANVNVTDEGYTGSEAERPRGRQADAPARQDAVAGQGPAQRDKPRPTEGKTPASEVSKAKLELQSRLPALKDDADIGLQKEHIVVRDGKADLRFSGVLLASAAPATAPDGHWKELRIYQTEGGNHVFSRVSRSVLAKESDVYEAEVFDPSPASVPSQLLKKTREVARGAPLTWMDAAVGFFGYEPLAKVLYRKLDVQFEKEVP
jgi:hypothetical protein